MAEAWRCRDLGEVTMRGHFAGFGGFFGLGVFLKRIPAVLGGSANCRRRPVCDYALIAAMSGWTRLARILPLQLHAKVTEEQASLRPKTLEEVANDLCKRGIPIQRVAEKILELKLRKIERIEERHESVEQG
jgi:hypothetical protein